MNENNEEYVDFGEEGQELEYAHQALEQGDYASALEQLEDYLEEQPLDVEALTLCALAATHLGDLPKAAGLYRNALRLNPGNSTAHHNFGVLLEEAGRFEEALDHLRRARDLQPDFPEIYINIGNVLDELGRTEEALLSYEEALRHLADEAVVYYNRGCVLNRLGRFQEALDSFARVPSHDSQWIAALNARGSALSGLGRDQEAIDLYNHAIALNSDVVMYYHNRGLSRMRLERYPEALEDFESVLRLQPELVETLLKKAWVLIQMQRMEESLTVLAEVERLRSDNAEAAFYRGVVLQRRGDLEGARQAFRESLLRDPNATPVLTFLGHVLLELEHLDDALGCFDRVLALQVVDPLASYDRACIFARRGQVRLALRDLRQAVKADSKYLEAAKRDASFDGVRDNRSFRRLLATGGA